MGPEKFLQTYRPRSLLKYLEGAKVVGGVEVKCCPVCGGQGEAVGCPTSSLMVP